jgi:Flp pilus assembly protein TadG
VFLAGLAVMAIQFFGLALTSAKVSHAAQEAAFVAGSSLEAASDRTPCWSIAGGLTNPDNYSDAAVCRSVLENLGNVNPSDVTVSVSPSLLERSNHAAIHVSVTYSQPISSPLLRLFMGNRFTTTSDASSWTN